MFIIVTDSGIWSFDNIDDARTFYCEETTDVGYVYQWRP